MAKKGWLADKKQLLLTPWKPRKKAKKVKVFSLNGKSKRKSRKRTKVFSL